MPDYFAQFGLPRQPWLDTDYLKQKFLALSAEAHPDKAVDKVEAEGQFQELNKGYNVLRTTRSRLQHLLELQGVPKAAHVDNVPPVALELFVAVASVSKRADSLLKEKTAAISPMLKAQYFQKAMDCVDALQQVQEQLQQRINQVDMDLKAANSRWVDSLPELGRAAAALGFLEKWKAQLQERSAALSF